MDKDKIKEESCEHLFGLIAYTKDLQVYGVDSNKAVFLQNKGFVLVECLHCGLEGWCNLD